MEPCSELDIRPTGKGTTITIIGTMSFQITVLFSSQGFPIGGDSFFPSSGVSAKALKGVSLNSVGVVPTMEY